jgi:hypothetical protein
VSGPTHALVQYSESLGPGNHVPCRVLAEEEDGRLRVQVLGREPNATLARRAGRAVVQTKDGPRWQWQPGTVHEVDDCDECRRGRR